MNDEGLAHERTLKQGRLQPSLYQALGTRGRQECEPETKRGNLSDSHSKFKIAGMEDHKMNTMMAAGVKGQAMISRGSLMAILQVPSPQLTRGGRSNERISPAAGGPTGKKPVGSLQFRR